MVNVFSQLSLPQLSSVARRAALSAVVLGAGGLLALAVAGYPVAGLGACLGLALAMGNFRMITVATAKAAASARADTRRPLALNTVARLGLLTGIVIALMFVSRSLAFGTVVGLAVFQFSLLANIVVSMLRNPMLGDTVMGEALPDDEEDA